MNSRTVYRICAQVAPSGECLWGKRPTWSYVGKTLAPSVFGCLYPLGWTWLLLLCCVTVCVSLLPCVADCCMLFNHV